MRLVVTGATPEGTSSIVRDDAPQALVAAAFPHFSNTMLAAADAPPVLPTGGDAPDHQGFFPPPGGFRWFVFEIDPETGEGPGHQPTPDELAAAETMFPGLFSVYDEEGMERTDTVDFGFVVSGEALLELDDGVTRTLTAGEAFVQNGTRHRWRNVGRERVRMVVFLLGVQRVHTD